MPKFQSNDMHTTTNDQPNTKDLFEEEDKMSANSIARTSFRLDRSGVLDCKTGLPIFTISTKEDHILCLPFGRSALTVTQSDTNAAIGTINVSKLLLNASIITLSINGRSTSLQHPPENPRWELKSTSLSGRKRQRTTLFWKRDEHISQTVVLVDAKETGDILARIDGDMLVFENTGLRNETVNEIVVSAIALAEHARKRTGDSNTNNLSRSIGDIAAETRQSLKAARNASNHHAKVRLDNRASRHHGASSGGFAFVGLNGAVGGGYDGGGGGGCGGGDGGGGGGC